MEQLLENEHFDAPGSKYCGELVVLLLCFLEPQHVVEEQLFLAGRSEPADADADAGTVHHDGAEPTDL